MNSSPTRRSDPTTSTDPQSSPWHLFGARVRQIRTEAGLSHADLTFPEVCPDGHLAGIEAGAIDPMRSTAEYLDRKLGAQGRLVDAWARTRISDHLASDNDIFALQRDACRIREFQPGALPEAFRTDAYAAALADAARPLRKRASLVEQQRLRRGQYSLHSGHDTPVTLIMDEAAVRAVVGSAATMRAQLEHLLAFQARGKVQLQIVPRTTTDHPCRTGGFRILTLSAHHALAYLPAPCGGGHLIT